MNSTKTIYRVLNILTILLLLITTVIGICSLNTSHSYEFVNQYGDSIQMWGAGIYAHDSYFKAPIFIGSDVTILLFVVPLSIVTFLRNWKEQSVENYIRSFGIISTLLYYSASVAFGVTYNGLHLVYIALFGVCFFSVCLLLAKLHTVGIMHLSFYKRNESIFDSDRNFTIYCMDTRHYYVYHKRNFIRVD